MNVMKKLLNEIAEVSAGQGAPQGDENYSIDGTPFVKAGNLHDLINGESIDLIQKVNDDIASKYRLKKFPAGTVVFAKSGMSCLKGYVYVLPTEAYVVNHLACIVPYFGLSEYLKFYFMHHKPSELIRDSSYPSIRLSDISDIVINLPELSECMDIVKILKNTERVIKIKKLQLLEFDQLIKSRFVEMFGDISINSKSFDIKPFGDLCFKIGDGLHGTPLYDDKGNYYFINGNNLGNDCIKITETTKKVNEEVFKKYYIQFGENTVFLSINGTLGNVALYNDEPIILGKSAAYCNLKPSLHIKFVAELFKTNKFKEYMLSNSSGTTITNFGLKAFRNYPMIVPPMILQTQFTKFVEQVDKLKFVVQKSLDETQKLFDSLMQEYFG